MGVRRECGGRRGASIWRFTCGNLGAEAETELVKLPLKGLVFEKACRGGGGVTVSWNQLRL